MDLPKPMQCPYCGELVEACTEIAMEQSGSVPDPGSVLVCGFCGEIAIVGPGGGLTKPAADELEAIRAEHPTELDVAEMLMAQTEFGDEPEGD